jgi:hypothetical protein
MIRKAAKGFSGALALAVYMIAGSAPTLAKSHYRMTQSGNTGQSSYAFAREDANENQISTTRAAAIHECNVAAAPYTMISWQTAQFAVYRTCMARHGQWPE